jgi:hypothetical protein
MRLLSNIGLYPRGEIRGPKGTYYLDQRLAFIAVRINEERAYKYRSEVTFTESAALRCPVRRKTSLVRSSLSTALVAGLFSRAMLLSDQVLKP